ncbi:MerC domain-containing protein [Sphingorhabdus sp.]|uniref:MerC domain-containing protein n=1 Tax=Sphingorhabdus sp. TaxID=1902408 RepID=UPI00391D81F1
MTRVWHKWRWDGLGLSIAGLCLLHCLITTVLLAVLASASGLLLDPVIHEVGLFLAIALGILALGKGFRDHGLFMPATIGALGIGMMGGALTLPHGGMEIACTVMGVIFLGFGHLLNHRARI